MESESWAIPRERDRCGDPGRRSSVRRVGRKGEEVEMGQTCMEGGCPGVAEAHEDPVGTIWDQLSERAHSRTSRPVMRSKVRWRLEGWEP